MSLTLASVFTAAEEAHRELPMPAIAYGAIALGAFFALLALLWSFRGTAQKVRSPRAGGHDGHGGH